MASWKKVVVSGSAAELASLTTSGNLTVNGNTTLGDAGSDTLTINSNQLNLGALAATANTTTPSVKFNASDAGGSTAGSITLQAVGTDVGDTNYTLTLPAATATLVATGTSPSFTNITATGNLTVNGNTTLGNAASDTLTVKSTELNLADGVTSNANRSKIKFNTYSDSPGIAGSVTLIGPNQEGGLNYTLTLPAATATLVATGTSPSFTNITATGNLTVQGNTTLGNAQSDDTIVKSTQLQIADALTANADRAEIKFNTHDDTDAGSVILRSPSGVGGTSYTINLPASNGTLLTDAEGVVSSSAQIDHDQTSNFVSNEHIDHSSVTITAGNGLTGGGDITATRTINVGAGTGIDVTADAIAVDVSDFMSNGSNNRIVTATGADAMNAESNLTFDGDTLTVTGTGSISSDLTVGGDLYVNGDIMSVSTANLLVEDPFILLASGSAATGDSGIIFGGSEGTAQSGTSLFWDASYNSNDGRLSIANTVSQNASSPLTPAYRIAGVFEGTDTNAATAQADHPGNIRIEGGEIYIYA